VKSCILCGSTEPHTVGSYPTGENAELCSCGLIYLSQAHSYVDSYSDGTFAEEVGRYTDKWGDRVKRKATIRHDIVMSLCGDFKSILDVGCSEGAFLDMFVDKDVMGIDPSTSRDEYISGEFPADMPDKMFDVITMFHSVEHVIDPIGFINGTHRHLADGGYLIVEYPDIGRKLMRDNAELTAMFDNNFHLFEFTQKTMGLLLSRCGYEIQNVICFSDDKNNTEYKNVAFVARPL